jgi:Ca2+-binding EF-hand superfamily protein
MIDIDKDGFITDPDLSTCVKNLNNSAFFRKGGEALKGSTFNQRARPYPKASRLGADKAREVCTQIREAMGVKQISYRTAFDNFDKNKDGMVSFAELQHGLESICPISQPVLEQLYALMDHQKIGLVSYDAFLAVLKNS